MKGCTEQGAGFLIVGSKVTKPNAMVARSHSVLYCIIIVGIFCLAIITIVSYNVHCIGLH